MFSPVLKLSNTSSLFFSLSLPFISSFTPFHFYGIFNPTVLFQLNLGLSMDSTTFVISHFSLFLHHLIFNLSLHFLFPPSTLVTTLSLPFHLVCLMVYPLSQLSSFHFPFSISFSFINLCIYLPSFQLSFLPSIFRFHWSLFPH